MTDRNPVPPGSAPERKALFLLIGCAVLGVCAMGFVDAVLQPGYAVKSGIKIVLFLFLPFLFSRICRVSVARAALRPRKSGLLRAVAVGIGIYVLIVGGYFLLKDVFDFSALTGQLTATTGVRRENFLWVALYISFVNSLLEEFFFRGFLFLTLNRISSRRFAYLFSSGAFSVYHIAMMIGWFRWPLVLLALAGLFVGGLIFDRCDETDGNIFFSWLIHMFANFATNTIGFLLFAG